MTTDPMMVRAPPRPDVEEVDDRLQTQSGEELAEQVGENGEHDHGGERPHQSPPDTSAEEMNPCAQGAHRRRRQCDHEHCRSHRQSETEDVGQLRRQVDEHASQVEDGDHDQEQTQAQTRQEPGQCAGEDVSRPCRGRLVAFQGRRWLACHPAEAKGEQIEEQDPQRHDRVDHHPGLEGGHDPGGGDEHHGRTSRQPQLHRPSHVERRRGPQLDFDRCRGVHDLGHRFRSFPGRDARRGCRSVGRSSTRTRAA